MILSLHRSHKMAVNITKPGGDARAFVFEVALGVRLSADVPLELQIESQIESQVDPLSGMLINLVRMDQILQELGQAWGSRSWNSLSDLLMESQKFLAGRVAQERVEQPLSLDEICLLEKRGFWLRWESAVGGKNFSGHEEIREVGPELFKLRSQYPFNEASAEPSELPPLKVNNTKDLFSEKIFLENPPLESLEVENLATGEKWSLRATP